MAINEIKPADIVNKGVIGLADVPGLTTAEMQKRMDELATDVIIPKVNELVKDANATNESLGTITNKFFVDTLTIADTSINAILNAVFRGAREKFGNNSYIADCIVNAGLSYHVTGYNVGGYGTFKAERYNGDGSISVWEATLFNNVWTAINEVPSLTKLNSDLESVSQNTKTLLLATSTTSSAETAEFTIPNHLEYNALIVQMYGDANLGGLYLYIPKAMFSESVAFSVDTTPYGSAYTLFACGRVTNGIITIRKSVVTGWSTFQIRVFGLK